MTALICELRFTEDSLMQLLASAVPREKHVPFLADLWAHLASYIVGFVGGIVLIGSTWRSRFKAQ